MSGGVPKGVRRCFSRSAIERSRAALIRSVESVIQSVADFLVEDACVLCGKHAPEVRPFGDARSAGSLGSCSGVAGEMMRPVRQRLGPVTIRNHPICGPCANTLPVARWRGVLGTVVGGCAVVTASGEWFGARVNAEARYPATEGAAQEVPGVPDVPVIAPFMENDETLRLIRLLKFSGYEVLARPMGLAMARATDRFGPIPTSDILMVPVPMTPRDRRLRGFNQSQRLARVAGGALGVPVVDLLTKVPGARRQSQIPRGARAGNVREAFHCPATVGGTVLLVDDLVTTGATAASCAAELLRSGAASVKVLCFARAL